MITEIKNAPYWNCHRREWENCPEGWTPPAGPIEIYSANDEPANDEPKQEECVAEFPTFAAAIDAIDAIGRYMWSRPDEGHYLGELVSERGSVALITY